MTFRILQGDNRDVLKTIESNSIDAIVTDPPYGIDFLGKSWDANTGALETYQECLRVLKPGGHILAFSAARTYHHLAVTLEQAGFEIRDQIMWIYSSGFPKSQDIGRSIQRSLGVKKTKSQKGFNGFAHKNGTAFVEDWNRQEEKNPEVICTDPEAIKWQGWGTSLKPAHEPICMARKPIKTSIMANVQKWGTGALNIDATRVEGDRFPSNVLGEIPDYQKYFYCPKVSRKERHMGFDTSVIPTNPDGMLDKGEGTRYIDGGKKEDGGLISRTEMVKRMGGYWANEQGDPKQEGEEAKMCWTPNTGLIYAHGITQEYVKWCKKNNIPTGNTGNNHPTVKPVALMEYLIKLVTPPGGLVLDPFNGSGSTGMAAVGLGFDYIGIELDPAYVKIAETRISAWADKHKATNNFSELFKE